MVIVIVILVIVALIFFVNEMNTLKNENDSNRIEHLDSTLEQIPDSTRKKMGMDIMIDVGGDSNKQSAWLTDYVFETVKKNLKADVNSMNLDTTTKSDNIVIVQIKLLPSFTSTDLEYNKNNVLSASILNFNNNGLTFLEHKYNLYFNLKNSSDILGRIGDSHYFQFRGENYRKENKFIQLTTLANNSSPISLITHEKAINSGNNLIIENPNEWSQIQDQYCFSITDNTLIGKAFSVERQYIFEYSTSSENKEKIDQIVNMINNLRINKKTQNIDKEKLNIKSNYFTKILELKDLLDKGAITQQDFDQKKAEWMKLL